MRIKLVLVFLISVAVLLITVPVLADNEKPELLPEEIFEESEFPGELSMPGRIEGAGTYFEIKDSEYLNIILESTKEIKVVLESIPKMISLDVEATTDGINSTELTLRGLEPNKTYYKYEDSYKTGAVFVSSENGNYSWTQDLSQSHHIWFQEEKGTTFIDKDTVLDHDILGSVEITANNITLDCNGHKIIGSGTGYGIYLNNKSGVTIQNCIITNFSYGIYLFGSNNQLTNIIANSNIYGILLQSSSNNKLTNITANSNKYHGISLSYNSNNNQFTSITANSNFYGIFLYSSSNNQLTNIITNSNGFGILFYSGKGNILTNIEANLNSQVGIDIYNYSSNNTLINITANLNGICGIYFYLYSNNNQLLNIEANSNKFGIYLDWSSSNSLTDIMVNSNNYGIYLDWGSKNNQFINIIANLNSQYGIYLDLSSGNIIYLNNFINNTSNIYSYSSTNFWNSPEKINYTYNNAKYTNYLGNYWSDYNGSDVNNDGIGDVSYSFTGGQDNYPLMFPFENYFEVPTNQPPTISNLGQFKSDGILSITEGNTTTESTVVFKTTLSDPDNDKIKLQIELRQMTEPFTEIDDGGILSSDFVDSGNEATITKEDLIDSQYHWRARAVDDKGNTSDWQEFGEIGNVDFVVEVPLSTKAAMLAKELVNSVYLYGGKGWDYNLSQFVAANTIKTGYNFWNQAIESKDFGAGVDCSGLIMWAYDRSFDPLKSRFKNFVKAEGADEQFRKNTELTTESELKPGDVMFFDWGRWHEDTQTWDGIKDGYIDHVAMYVGENGGYDVVNAASPGSGIVARSKDTLKNIVGFVAFKQVVSAVPLAMLTTSHSPVDLIVTDPDGFTITPTTTIPSDEEYLREIPGVLYYSEMEKGADGNPIDQVYSYTTKTGDYTIKVLPDLGASPTSTYTLDFSAGDQSTTLAQNVPISQIPSQGYGITTSATGTLSTFIPVAIDIKPGSYPNSINLGSNGVVPIAIFGSATFDVKQIDPTTIKLADASVKLKGNGQPMAGYSDINGDGFTDVVAQVSTQALQLTSSEVKTNLEGQLTSGVIIKGSDSVRIVP